MVVGWQDYDILLDRLALQGERERSWNGHTAYREIDADIGRSSSQALH